MNYAQAGQVQPSPYLAGGADDSPDSYTDGQTKKSDGTDDSPAAGGDVGAVMGDPGPLPALGAVTKGPLPARGASGAGSVSGTMSTRGQKHFYMETQTTLCEPAPGGKLTVSCATQCMQLLRQELSAVLNHAKSKITVQNTQTGGAYGGKAFLHVPVAAATCVAALVANTPVLCQVLIPHLRALITSSRALSSKKG